MASTLSVVECRPPLAAKEVSYPNVVGGYRSKVARGCSLSSLNKSSTKSCGNLGTDVYPLQGVSLLPEPSNVYSGPQNTPRNQCQETEQIYDAPQNTPRSTSDIGHIGLYSSRNNSPRSFHEFRQSNTKFVHRTSPRSQLDIKESYGYLSARNSPRCQQEVLDPEVWSEDEEKPLSVVGEKFNSLAKRSQKISLNASGPSSAHDKPSNKCSTEDNGCNMSTFSCDESLYEPLVPPPTPSECSFSSFKVDGFRITNSSEPKFLSTCNRDFTPGYVRRTTYCCDKCAERMTGHETFLQECGSSFFPLQRHTSLSYPVGQKQVSESTLSSDDLCHFLKSSFSYTQEEQRNQRLRLWGYPEMENNLNQKQELKDKKKKTKQPRTENTPNTKDHESREGEMMDSVIVNGVPGAKNPIMCDKIATINNKKEQGKETEGSKKPAPDTRETESLARKSNIDQIGDGNSNPDSEVNQPDPQNDSKMESFSDSMKVNKLFWSETWPLTTSKSEDILVTYPTYDCNNQNDSVNLPEISVKHKAPENGQVSPEGDMNHNTCDDGSSLQESKSYSRERVQQVLQECADIVEIPKRSFLPDISVPVNNDICFTAVIDKRYNRWKRRKRKRGVGESVTPPKPASPCESSSEEIKEPPVRESPPVTLRLRRRKRVPEETEISMCGRSHELHYDASSETTTSDKDGHNIYSLNEYLAHKSSDSKDSIEEHQDRIQAAIENITKESVKAKVDAFQYPSSPTKRDETAVQELGSAILQTIPVPLTKKEPVTPPIISPTLTSRREEVPRLKVATKIPSMKSSTSCTATSNLAKKYPNIQNNGGSGGFLKPLERSLVFHTTSDSGSSMMKFLVDKDELQGKTRGQTTGLVKIRMDKNAKERLIMSKIARNKTIGNGPLSEDSKTEGRNLKSVTVNHLLQTMATSTSISNDLENKKPDHKKNEKSSSSSSDQQTDDEKLSPRIVSLQPKSDSKLHEAENTKPKDNVKTGIDRRKCIALKKGSVVSLRKQKHDKKPVDFNTYEETRSVSSLSFTPAFSYSLFELPEIYKKYNKEIERRASVAYCLESKIKI